jgi:hypothetical protein
MKRKDLTVKCLLLKNNDVLVSEIIEVGSELGEPDCKLINPYKLIEENDNQFLIPWITFSNQSEIMIHSDSILTIVEPNDKIKSLYFELIS